MTRFETLRFSFLCAILACATPSASFGQGVAIIDVAAVFKAHQTFTQQLDAIRNQAESLRTSSMQMQQDFARKAESLKQLEPSSQQFRDAETSLAKEAALLDMNQKEQIRNLMQLEAKLHYDTYQQVNSLIAQYCESKGITLVLRYSNDSLDEANPESIMLKVNSSIIYHQPGRDITSQIVALLPTSEPRSTR